MMNESLNHSIMDLFEDTDNSENENHKGPNEEEMLFECPFCSKSESDESHLKLHIESHHADSGSQDGATTIISSPSNPEAKPSTASNSNSYSTESVTKRPSDLVCPYCDVPHEKRENLASHLTTCHGNDIEKNDLEELVRNLDLVLCPLCTYICCSETEMQWHVDGQHSMKKQFPKSENGLLTLSSTDLSVSVCPVCGLEEPDMDLLNSHIELHFETTKNFVPQYPSLPSTSITTMGQGQTASSSSSKSSFSSSSSFSSLSGTKAMAKRKPRNKYKQQYRQGMERAVLKGKLTPGEYHERFAKMRETELETGVDDGHSSVEGVIEKLASFCGSHCRKDYSALLCSPTDYYCGSYGDRYWGCGYRNFQMMLSCLQRIPFFSAKLSTGVGSAMPSIPKVQEMIETAWQKGFDRAGCQQLKAKLVNTRKWIGSTEIVTVLSSLGVKCELVDFSRPTAPDGTHPRLFQWVRDYFHMDQHRPKPPLYLQHHGHSRSIVGVEEEKGTLRLLLFDPCSSVEQVTSLKNASMLWKKMGLVRVTLATFSVKQYQIVAVTGLLEPHEYERSKRLVSTRIS